LLINKPSVVVSPRQPSRKLLHARAEKQSGSDHCAADPRDDCLARDRGSQFPLQGGQVEPARSPHVGVVLRAADVRALLLPHNRQVEVAEEHVQRRVVKALSRLGRELRVLHLERADNGDVPQIDVLVRPLAHDRLDALLSEGLQEGVDPFLVHCGRLERVLVPLFDELRRACLRLSCE
jgi:hypothetical protein